MTDVHKENTAGSTSSSEPQKKNLINILSIILIGCLLATWGYILWDKSRTRDLVQQKDNLITSTSNQRDELQKELEDATMRYDLLKVDNSRKDSVILEKDRDIELKKSRIKSLLSKINASASEIQEAKDLIASLNTDIDSYKQQIARLEGQNAELTLSNEKIARDRDRITKQYDSSLEELKSRDEIIDIGSTLQASNFQVYGLDQRAGGKIKVTSTAKKVDRLRITFDLNENLITPSGTKTLFIVITDPEGKVCSSPDLGSGSFTARDGRLVDFTQRMDIDYTQNKRQSVSFDWKGAEKFATGNYKIEVYNNGYKVGEGSRPLKKGGLFS